MDEKSLSNTKRYLAQKGATFREVLTVTLPTGQEQEVVVFSGSRSLVAQATTFDTIVVHENVFRSEKCKDYVMVHETAHLRQWYSHWQFAAAVSIIPSVLVAIFTQNIVIGFVVFAALLFGFKWFIEFNADSQSIRTLGIETVREAKADGKALFHPTILGHIFNRITHPPISLTYLVMRALKLKLGSK
jgi:hypothetical protein